MCMFVMLCLEMFYAFILSETCMEGLQHVKVFICVGKVWVRLPKAPERIPQGGPKGCRHTALIVPINEPM